VPSPADWNICYPNYAHFHATEREDYNTNIIMPRFVLLHHQMPPESARLSHWDLMLERDDTGELATWALDELPQPQLATAAVRLSDHRADYLDYEGPVSGNRGTVARVDAGKYQTVAQSNTSWELQLNGEQMQGRAKLIQSPTDPDAWTLTWFAEQNVGD
jgi:hypothetical protein